jgi:hypothetical protein
MSIGNATIETSNAKPPSMNTNIAAPSILFLGQTGEFWDLCVLISLGCAIIVAVAVAISTAGSVAAHRREARAAEQALDRFKTETAGKVADATKAGIAAGETAGNANVVAAQANERAATANLEAERLKEQLGWRDVTLDQAKAIAEALNGRSMRLAFHWTLGDAEGSMFVHKLAHAFQLAGCEIVGGGAVGYFGQERYGVEVDGSDAGEVQAVKGALEAAGYGTVETQVVAPNDDGSPKLTDIVVGYRAQPILTAPLKPKP